MGVPEQTSRQEDHEDSLLLQPSWRWHLVPLRKSPSLDPTQRLRLIPGMATTATDLTDMATITERGLLTLSQLLRLLPTLRLRLIPGMDTTATATDHTDMATTATGLMVMLTGVKRYSDLSLPTLL